MSKVYFPSQYWANGHDQPLLEESEYFTERKDHQSYCRAQHDTSYRDDHTAAQTQPGTVTKQQGRSWVWLFGQ